jgi:hypothetical protein
MDYHQIKDEIDSAIEWHKENMPKDIRELISKARYDLYYGPSYYDTDDDECSMWDDGAKAFNFSEACDKIRDYLNEIDDVTEWVYGEDDDGGEIEDEIRVDGTADQIKLALVGRELYSYVR